MPSLRIGARSVGRGTKSPNRPFCQPLMCRQCAGAQPVCPPSTGRIGGRAWSLACTGAPGDGRSAFRVRCCLAVAFFALLWSGGLAWFAEASREGADQPDLVTEAIVVPTGGTGQAGGGFAPARGRLGAEALRYRRRRGGRERGASRAPRSRALVLLRGAWLRGRGHGCERAGDGGVDGEPRLSPAFASSPAAITCCGP